MSVFGDIVDGGVSLLNYGLQERTLAWQKDVQRETWNREDSAVQRRVADLKAAGLSPVLAAGSAAQSGAPISVTTPQLKYSAKEQEAMTAALVKQKADISRTEAETEAIRLQNSQRLFDAQILSKIKGYKIENGEDWIDRYARERMESLDAENSVHRSNALTAAYQAAAAKRSFEFDERNDLYGDVGRRATELQNLIENKKFGPALGALLEMLGKLK